jgi:oxygen-dependent protoporphyrinogen oxidase
VVRSLSVVPEGYCLEVGETRASESITFDRVVLAAPGPACARILRSVAPRAVDRVSAIEYASVALVTLVYSAENVPRQVTSGFLVPATMGRSIKAATFATNKWEWTREHAGDDVVVIRASLGRAGEEVVLQRDDDELMALAHGDLTAALGISAPPRAWSVTRWGGALPQYTVGHVDLVSAIRSDLAHLPGLALAGAAFDGVGIPAVIASAHAAAEAVTADLAS